MVGCLLFVVLTNLFTVSVLTLEAFDFTVLIAILLLGRFRIGGERPSK